MSNLGACAWFRILWAARCVGVMMLQLQRFITTCKGSSTGATPSLHALPVIAGSAGITVLGSDLTHEYVAVNADYRS